MGREIAIRTLVAAPIALILGASTVSAQLGLSGFLRYQGLDAGSSTGSAVALGDFNRDGIDDLVIAAPHLAEEGVGPEVGGIVVYTGPPGLPTLLTVLRPGDLDGVESQAGAAFGWALAVGDFDADGRDDLAVGIPGYTVNGVDRAGAVVVLYGQHGIFPLGDAELFSQAPLSGAVEEGDFFGFTLAAGDLSGDGVDDLAIGVVGEDLQVGGVPVSDAGAVNVVYGVEAVGLTTAGNQLLHHQVAGVDGTAGEDDWFGFALAIGKFTGDTYQDLAVGIPGMGDFLVGGQDGFGGVRIFRGGAGGIDLSQNEPIWFQGTPGVLGTESDDDGFGTALAVGDFDGDGVDDLAIGVPGEDEFGPDGSGAVQILYGTTGYGLDDLGDQFFSESLFDGDVDGGDGFGEVLAAADFDLDGHDDLAIGAPHDDSLGASDAGEVTILYGTDTGLSVAGAQLANMFLVDTLEHGDRFGAALATGRYNSDQGPDLAIGVPNRAFDDELSVGTVVVLFSRTLFADGFETGDTSAWSTSVGGS
jgi:hypothetical protein